MARFICDTPLWHNDYIAQQLCGYLLEKRENMILYHDVIYDKSIEVTLYSINEDVVRADVTVGVKRKSKAFRGETAEHKAMRWVSDLILPVIHGGKDGI